MIGLLLPTSCSESFFERYPTDSMTAENYLNNVDEIQTFLYSAYAAMAGNFANSVVYIGDLPTDNAYDYKLNNSSAHIALHESTVDSQNSVISSLWYACYQIINRSCLVIDNMEAFATSPEYDQIVGEAKFLRAYTYYVMVRVWGAVPLVLEDITDYMEVFDYGRTPVDQVYDQIISDLKDAEAKLPSFYSSESDKGKATSTAAQAILGDVYLTRHDYTNAKLYFERVIAKEGANLGLLNDIKSIYVQDNANNKEIIFAVQYGHNQTPSMSNYLGSCTLGNIQGIPIAPVGAEGSQIYGVNVLMMTHELEAKFVPGDGRRALVYTNLVSPDYGCTIPMSLKYFDYQNVADGKSGTPDSGCETIISRYADILLKYAECLNEEDNYAGAIAQIERVRERAGLTTTIASNKTAVAEAIELERQLELCMEGHRWFDLVRTGRVQTVMGAFYNRDNAVSLPNTISVYEYGEPLAPSSVENHELVFPLPYAQVELNPSKLIQNDGY